jgi:prevent-host-death family protein
MIREKFAEVDPLRSDIIFSMSTVTLQDLQQNSTALLDRVKAGEHLVVTDSGRPVAELRPVVSTRTAPRPFGLASGAFAVPDDFDAPLPDDILMEFEGR